MSKPLKVFITYSHKNAKEKDKLITYLAVMTQEGLIDPWHDNEILPGDRWREEIFSSLVGSDILLYLTSTDSLASENCNKELSEALNVEINAKIRVIPIILEHCDWENHELQDFEVLPDKGKPINEWQPRSKGWQKVVDGLRRSIREIPSQVAPSSNRSEEDLRAGEAFQYGNFLMMLGELDEAIEAYSQSIGLRPQVASPYNNRGSAYGNKGDYECAIADYTKAIELKSDDAEAYKNRGNAYGEKGDYECAIADYTKAIELKSDDAEAYNNRGVTYQEKGEIDLAIADYTKAIELNPELVVVYSNRGESWLYLKEWEKAKADLITAKNMGLDIIASFHNEYASVEDFEQRHGVKLPEDIAAMLTLQ